jgi:hypothetical protein
MIGSDNLTARTERRRQDVVAGLQGSSMHPVHARAASCACRASSGSRKQRQQEADLQVAEQRLRLDVEHLGAVVHHLGLGAFRVRDVVDVLVEVLQRRQQGPGSQSTNNARRTGKLLAAAHCARVHNHWQHISTTAAAIANTTTNWRQSAATGSCLLLRNMRTQKMVRQILLLWTDIGILEPIQ